jgi:signal transduction histidine kinase
MVGRARARRNRRAAGGADRAVNRILPGTAARRAALSWSRMTRLTRWHWAGVTLFWTFVGLMYAAQILWLAQLPGERVNVRAAIAWQSTYYACWIPFTMLVWRVTRHWLPDGRRGWPRLLARHVPLFVAVLLSLMVVVTLIAPSIAAQPAPLWESYWMQVRGRAHLTVLIYTAVAGTGMALTLSQRDRDRQAAAAHLQSELAAARLRALRGHLEPHFLFNSLHSIAALARSQDTAGVVRLTASLSDILRHVLDVGDRPSRLRDEFQVVERYLEIQRARFADRLDVSLTLAAEVADARVPLLVVQPLVENALKHGLAPRVQPGTLTVSAWLEEGRTRIDVEDDGVGLPDGWTLTGTPGTGLRNLASRLAAEFGERAALTVRSRSGGGVCATVTLPYAAA